jgi:hypothetical protein
MRSVINVQEGQSIFDVLIGTRYTFDNLYKLIQENPAVPSINYSFDSHPNTKVSYDSTFATPPPPSITVIPAGQPATTATLKAVNGQTIFDVLTMTYGTFDHAIKLIQDNGIDNLNEFSVDQKAFTLDTTLIKDEIYYKSLGSYVIATADSKYLPGGALESASFEPLQTAEGFQILQA